MFNQSNDYIYQSTSLNQTTLYIYIYIYMQSFPYLYDDERPDERTNKYIAQTTTHIRRYTQAQCYFFYLSVIGLLLSFHFVPFLLPISSSFDKESIKYIFLCFVFPVA